MVLKKVECCVWHSCVLWKLSQQRWLSHFMNMILLALAQSSVLLFSCRSLPLSKENGERSATQLCANSFVLWNSKRPYQRRLLLSERTLPLPGKTKIRLLEKQIFFSNLQRWNESFIDPEAFLLPSCREGHTAPSFLWCTRCSAKGPFMWDLILLSQKCSSPLSLLLLPNFFSE